MLSALVVSYSIFISLFLLPVKSIDTLTHVYIYYILSVLIILRCQIQKINQLVHYEEYSRKIKKRQLVVFVINILIVLIHVILRLFNAVYIGITMLMLCVSAIVVDYIYLIKPISEMITGMKKYMDSENSDNDIT